MDALQSMQLPVVPASPRGHTLTAQTSAKDPHAVDKVASGFESMFWSLILKEMRQSLEPDTLFPGDSGDVMGGLFDSFLSQHFAHLGAFGIAAMVKQQLDKKQP